MGADNQAENILALWEMTEKFVREILQEMNGREPDAETVSSVRAEIMKILRKNYPVDNSGESRGES